MVLAKNCGTLSLLATSGHLPATIDEIADGHLDVGCRVIAPWPLSAKHRTLDGHLGSGG
jgi:hypothetical protein